MPLVLRSLKGEPLTIQEMDANFTQLDARLRILEDALQTEATLTVQQQNDTLIFRNHNGDDIGRAHVPMWMPRPRGAFEEGTFYAFGDWVNYKNGLYFCHAPHQTTEGFEADKWTVLFKTGEDHV